MDKLDVRIMALLQKDGTSTNAMIARQLGVSEETIRRRLKKLTFNESIKIVAVPNASLMGYKSQVIIGLQVDAGLVDEVGDELSEMIEVTWVVITTGSFDIFAWATLKSTGKLNDFLLNRVGKLPGVRKMETFINLEIRKEQHGIDLEAMAL